MPEDTGGHYVELYRTIAALEAGHDAGDQPFEVCEESVAALLGNVELQAEPERPGARTSA